MELQAEPLFYYQMVPGKSLRLGAVIRDGKTLVGPVTLPVIHKFAVGEYVEVNPLYTKDWKRAWVSQRAPYRGRPGYYITWVLPADAPSWVSRGGWVPETAVRKAQ